MALRSMRWSRFVRPLAVIAFAATLSAGGCNRSPGGLPKIEQAENKENGDKSASPVDGDKSDAGTVPVSTGVDDPLQVPFAKAVRTGDNPPSDVEPPPAKTVTGKSVYKLYQEVIHQWDAIRFTTGDGKKIVYTATIETALGAIDIEMRPDLAPNHVRNFVALARAGYYDGLFFDRIYHDENVADPKERLDEIEAGCPLGTGDPGTGSIGYWLYPEFQPTEKVTHEEGTVGACHGSAKDTAGCRFYITLCKFPNLDGNFTVFGKVTRGLDVARKIFQQPVIISPEDLDNSRRPEKPVVMQKVTIHTRELDR